jgi:hypothetical protein
MLICCERKNTIRSLKSTAKVLHNSTFQRTNNVFPLTTNQYKHQHKPNFSEKGLQT